MAKITSIYSGSTGAGSTGLAAAKTAAQSLPTAAAKTGASGGFSLPGMDLFTQYYNQILGMMQVPSISVSVPSRASLEADFSASMRPNVDLAIGNRRSAGERTKAELDADAAARGMGGSTFLSSMKEREGDDVETDVATLEAQYSASLAERIQDAMMEYQQMSMQANMFNAQMQQSAMSTAMGVASTWYTSYLSGLSSSRRNGGGGGSSKQAAVSNAFSGLTLSQCEQYVDMLDRSEKLQLFSSDQSYWADRRAELEASLGDDYTRFVNRTLRHGQTR